MIVAGGGIGGLAAALALARKGFKSVVLEQAPQFGEIGAGIQIAPNAWHALDALGVGALVKKEAVFIEHLLMMDGVSGEKVIDIPLDARFAKRFANPYAVTHRADIHGSLVDGCKALPQMIELRIGSTLTVIEFRHEKQRLYGALVEHRLRPQGDTFRIAHKRVDLVNSEGELDGIAILL